MTVPEPTAGRERWSINLALAIAGVGLAALALAVAMAAQGRSVDPIDVIADFVIGFFWLALLPVVIVLTVIELRFSRLRPHDRGIAVALGASIAAAWVLVSQAATSSDEATAWVRLALGAALGGAYGALIQLPPRSRPRDIQER